MSYYTIDDSLERLRNIGSLFSSLIIANLTTSLVYYNFYQMPEIKFTDFLINPIVGMEDGSNNFHNSTVKEDFMEYGRVRTDVYSKTFPFRIRKVECEKPGIIIVENNITNLGLITANINKIKYHMTYPKQARPIVITHSKYPLSHQETTMYIQVRIPAEKIWNYALKDGIIMLKFEAIGGTGRCSKHIWIRISNDLRLIEWFESESGLKMLLFNGWLSMEKWRETNDTA